MILRQELLPDFQPVEVSRVVYHSQRHQLEFGLLLAGLYRDLRAAERAALLTTRWFDALVQTVPAGLDYENAVAFAHTHQLAYTVVSYGDTEATIMFAKDKRVLDLPDAPQAGAVMPECCRLFNQECDQAGYIVRTAQWAMNTRTLDQVRFDAAVELGQVTVESNMVLAAVGLRFCPWHACSPDCTRSIQAGATVRGMMDAKSGRILSALLAGPLEASIFHGVAELTAVPARWVVTAQATAHRYVVKTGQPAAGLVQITTAKDA